MVTKGGVKIVFMWEPASEEKFERIGLHVIRALLWLFLALGMLHALRVLVTGVYDVEEFETTVRLAGWNARVAALMELALFVVSAFWIRRFGDESEGSGKESEAERHG